MEKWREESKGTKRVMLKRKEGRKNRREGKKEVVIAKGTKEGRKNMKENGRK